MWGIRFRPGSEPTHATDWAKSVRRQSRTFASQSLCTPVPITTAYHRIHSSFMKTPALLLTAVLCFAPAATVLAATPGRENPVPVRTVAPEYPRDLKASGVSGLVMVKCTIDEQGNVAGTDIVKSSNEQFDR